MAQKKGYYWRKLSSTEWWLNISWSSVWFILRPMPYVDNEWAIGAHLPPDFKMDLYFYADSLSDAKRFCEAFAMDGIINYTKKREEKR